MFNCLAQFLESLQRRVSRYVAFPCSNEGERPLAGLRGCTRVAVRTPSKEEPAYRRLRSFHSMELLLVCDARAW